MKRSTVLAVPLCVLLTTVAAAEPHAPAFPRPRAEPRPDRGSAAALAAYAASQAALEARRAQLAKRWSLARTSRERARVVTQAREVIERGLVDLIDPWVGTTWEFSGTTQEPGRGAIACGYFVTTLLRDAGLKLERVRLAQLASEYLVRTVAPERRIWRFRKGDVGEVLQKVRQQPERWFVVGLDLHVGLLLRLDGGEVLMCHSSYLPPGYMICEDAQSAGAMVSRYHVVGALFSDDLVSTWLQQSPVTTTR